MQVKKILLAADHGGATLKNALCKFLQAQSIPVVDFGPKDNTCTIDYPDQAQQLIQNLKHSRNTVGILICTTGIGMSIAANRFSFIRAALVQNVDMAEMARRHNDANVLVFGAKYMTQTMAKKCVSIFLKTPFDGGRHQRRVKKLTQMKG